MGLSASISNFDRNQHFLIGDLSLFPVCERKLFSISHLVILNSRHKTRDKEPSDEPYRFTSGHWMNVTSGTSSDRTVRCVGLCEEVCKYTSNLFEVLPLEKPLYATQTFIQWQVAFGYSSILSFCRPERRTLYLQPLEKFPQFISDFTIKLEHYPLLDFWGFLQLFASIFFHGMDVKICPAVDPRSENWNITTRNHSKTGYKQYLVGDFYTKLQKIMPHDGCGILGIIWTDLYPCEELNFVLGEVSYAHKAGVFSFGRCEPKSYNIDTFSDVCQIDASLIWRLLKVLSHEFCHVFGFAHCEYFQCSMNGSSSLSEAFTQPLLLCPVCLRKLQHVCGFRLLERYTVLYTFLTDLQQLYPLPQLQKAIVSLHSYINFLQQSEMRDDQRLLMDLQ